MRDLSEVLERLIPELPAEARPWFKKLHTAAGVSLDDLLAGTDVVQGLEAMGLSRPRVGRALSLLRGKGLAERGDCGYSTCSPGEIWDHAAGHRAPGQTSLDLEARP